MRQGTGSFAGYSAGHVQEGEASLHAATVRAILQSVQRSRILAHCSSLCPLSLVDVSQEVLAMLYEVHAHTLDMLVDADAAGRGGQEGAVAAERLSTEQLLRLLLAVQMNAFQSGVYLRLAMVNHSCWPNCVKLTLQGGKCALLEACFVRTLRIALD
jgi:hypothetical protein